ncbi:MAG: MFS transporter [Actinomycetota bacterium]
MARSRDTIFGQKKNVFWLGLTSLFTDISSEMVYPIVPIFATTVLGAPVTFVGLVEGIAESTASLLKVFSGWLSDRLNGRKKLTVAGYALSALGKPILIFSTAVWQILAYRFVDRAGKGIRTAPRDALIADSSDCDNYGKSFGFHRTMDTIGAMLGPTLAFLLLPVFAAHSTSKGYRELFMLAVVPAVIGVIIIFAFVKEKRIAVPSDCLEPPAAPKISLKPFNRRFKLFLLVVLVFTLGNSSDAFLILRARNVGLAVVLIPLAYLLFNTVNAALATPAGIISDRLGRFWVMALGFLVFAGVYLGFALADSQSIIWLMFALYGFYYAFTESILKAYTADLVPANLRGTAYGLLNMTMGMALLPASLFAGWLWVNVSVRAPFFYGAGMAALALLLLLIFLPRGRQNAAGTI